MIWLGIENINIDFYVFLNNIKEYFNNRLGLLKKERFLLVKVSLLLVWFPIQTKKQQKASTFTLLTN